jgi:hypothetical protein
MYQKLTMLKDIYGFKNICELDVALLSLLLNHLDAIAGMTLDSDVTMEISNLFIDMTNYQSPKYGERTKRIKTKHIDYG